MEDLREEFFLDAPWYSALEQPREGSPSAWYFAKGPSDRAHISLVNDALAFAKHNALDCHYKARLAGISPRELTPERARSEGRGVCFPLFEVLNELIVATLLSGALGWRFTGHEPLGHQANRGDWEFALASGKHVLVEVKSLSEPDYGDSVFTKPTGTARITNVLKRAYKQLPRDERATVVVLVAEGGVLLDDWAGIHHGDLFQVFFGKTVVRFDFDGTEIREPRLTSTFRETYVQPRKNRRLGAVFGLELRGIGTPAPNLYALHNPFAHNESALPLSATTRLSRFYVDRAGRAQFERGVGGDELWQFCCRERNFRAPAA